eukprot:152754-Chlamydomonas_euryale.AAC.10
MKACPTIPLCGSVKGGMHAERMGNQTGANYLLLAARRCVLGHARPRHLRVVTQSTGTTLVARKLRGLIGGNRG